MEKEYLKILNSGSTSWNEWCSINSKEKIWLNDQELSGRDFSNYKFKNCLFSRSRLFEAKLSNCLFEECLFRTTAFDWADLNNSKFINTFFIEATAKGANLSNCYFENTHINSTNLALANLENSIFINSEVSNLMLGATNLSNVKGLEALKHSAFSMIDHTTIQMSKTIPVAFLKGCGLNDNLIDYYPSLLNIPINYYSCFLSHSSKDKEFVEILYDSLIINKIRCWYSAKDLKIGDKFRAKIDESINHNEKFIIVLSENSVQSQWVENEIESALEKERKCNTIILFPVTIDREVMNLQTGWAKYIRNTRNIGNFVDWKMNINNPDYFKNIINDLKK